MVKKVSRKSMNRTPLGDISNGKRFTRDDAKKKIQTQSDQDSVGGYFDRLLLLRSKLSSLVCKIDEIIAQPSEHDMKLSASNEEIETLSNLLSEMHSSLEPWLLRLSQSQTTSKTVVQVCKSLQKNHLSSAHRERRNISLRIKDEEPNLDTIVSPSPLVAWRAGGCELVTEKQLFLLTPLSKMEELSRFSGSVKIKGRNLYLKTPIMRNLDTVSEILKEFDGSKLSIVAENSMGKTRLRNQSEEAHQKKKSNRRKDEDEEALEWFLSPPKTCTLMDPNHGSNPSEMEDKSLSCKDPKIHVTAHSVDSLAARGDDNMLEFFRGSKKSDNYRGKNDFDEALEWFLSPPKTCIVMEPLKDGKVPPTPVIDDDSVLKSRRAGETTLKKELWTKFQAVSIGRISYKDSVFQRAEKKGFMDMLEEVT